MPKKKTAKEAEPIVETPTVSPEVANEVEESNKKAKKIEPTLVLTKGKFSLFETNDGYQIKDNELCKVICSGSDIEKGSKLLYGLAR